LKINSVENEGTSIEFLIYKSLSANT